MNITPVPQVSYLQRVQSSCESVSHGSSLAQKQRKHFSRQRHFHEPWTPAQNFPDETQPLSSSLVIFYRLIWFHYFFLFFHFHDIILTFEVNLTESNGVNRRLPDDCMTAYSDKEAYLFILHFPGRQVLPLAMGHAYGRHEQRSQWLDRHVYDATCCKAVG